MSQDTSAYGVDVQVPHRLLAGPSGEDEDDRARARARRTRRVGAPALCLSVSARRRRDSADGGRQAAAVSRRAVPAREPAHPEADEAAGQCREHARAHPRLARDLPRHHDPLDVHRGLSRRDGGASSRNCSRFSRKRSSTAWAASPTRRSTAPRPTPCPTRCPPEVREDAASALHGRRRRGSAPRASSARSARRWTCWSTRSTATSRIARSAADAPEIDGIVRVDGRRRAARRRIRARHGRRRRRARSVRASSPVAVRVPGARRYSVADSPPCARRALDSVTRVSVRLRVCMRRGGGSTRLALDFQP